MSTVDSGDRSSSHSSVKRVNHDRVKEAQNQKRVRQADMEEQPQLQFALQSELKIEIIFLPYQSVQLFGHLFFLLRKETLHVSQF